MQTIAAAMAASLLMFCGPVGAQESRQPGATTYKLELDFHDGSDAAAKNPRRYTLLLDPNRKAVVKIGNRVPVATGSFQPGVGGVGVNPLVNTQYTYIDVGVNIECMLWEVNGKVGIHGSIDFSTLEKQPAPVNTANPPNPTVGQTKVEMDTAVELGKPTVIATIDDPVNLRKLQVQATATKVN